MSSWVPRILGGLFGIVCVSLAIGQQAGPLRPSPLPSPLLMVQAPQVDLTQFPIAFPGGSRIVVRREDGAVVNLTGAFFAATHPRVSPDGASILFSAQLRRGDAWQVWEMRADGSGARQLTQGSAGCFGAEYLPNHEIAYTRAGATHRRDSEIWVSQQDGAQAHPVTFGPGGFRLQAVMASGRLLLSARWPLRARATATRELYRVHPDGTGLALLRDPVPGERRGQAIETADGSIVFVALQARPGAGERLMRLRPGAVHAAVWGPAPQGLWQPSQLAPGELAVARRDPAGTFALYRFQASRGAAAGLLFSAPRLNTLEAVPLRPQSMAWRWWSILKILNPPAYQAQRGQLLSLDSYLTADARGGRLRTPIARVRVLERQPNGGSRVLGTAPVAADGSFYIDVPADRGLRFELLDAAGHVIHAQRGWIWVRPDEQRGCVGCHESRALAPPNHWPLILRRHDIPTRLGVTSAASKGH